MKVRASQTPVFIHCPASIIEAEKSPGNTSEPAEEGGNCHGIVSDYLLDKGADLSDAADSERSLYFQWLRLWTQSPLDEKGDEQPPLNTYFLGLEMHIEKELVTEYMTGHPDLWAYNYEIHTLLIVDWKFGRLENEAAAYKQLKSYAELILENHPDIKASVETIFITPGWVRNKKTEWREVSVSAIAKHAKQIKEGLEYTDQYVTGPHCMDCGGRDVCQSNLSACRSLAEVKPGEVMTAAQAIDVYGKIKAWSRTLKEAERALKAMVSKTGPITHDGLTLQFGEPTERREIDYGAAKKTLIDHIGRERLERALKVNNGDIESAVRAIAPTGEKGQYVRNLWTDLEEVSAVNRKQSAASLILKESRT